MWNEICFPFHKLYHEIFYEMDSGMRFKLLPNGLQKLFREKSQNVWETDYEFRFITLWNGFCNPFIKKIAIFFETDYRICIPFPINFDFPHS